MKVAITLDEEEIKRAICDYIENNCELQGCDLSHGEITFSHAEVKVPEGESNAENGWADNKHVINARVEFEQEMEER